VLAFLLGQDLVAPRAWFATDRLVVREASVLFGSRLRARASRLEMIVTCTSAASGFDEEAKAARVIGSMVPSSIVVPSVSLSEGA
jgi:hypothetical protein